MKIVYPTWPISWRPSFARLCRNKLASWGTIIIVTSHSPLKKWMISCLSKNMKKWRRSSWKLGRSSMLLRSLLCWCIGCIQLTILNMAQLTFLLAFTLRVCFSSKIVLCPSMVTYSSCLCPWSKARIKKMEKLYTA